LIAKFPNLVEKKKIVQQDWPKYKNHSNGGDDCSLGIWDGGNGSYGSRFLKQVNFLTFFLVLINYVFCLIFLKRKILLMFFFQFHFELVMCFVLYVSITKLINTNMIVVSYNMVICYVMKKHLVKSLWEEQGNYFPFLFEYVFFNLV
jgi:hypothetical protein